jgi:hypothetical protein
MKNNDPSTGDVEEAQRRVARWLMGALIAVTSVALIYGAGLGKKPDVREAEGQQPIIAAAQAR